MANSSPQFCTQADLERAIGGAKELTQLLDKTGSLSEFAAMVDQCLNAASNELASYFQVTVDLASLRPPYQFVLVSKTADAAAFFAWRYGAYGQPIPEHVVQAYEAAIRWAQDVGAKKATLGSSPMPTLGQTPVGTVDHDADGSGVSVEGFKRGFR